MGKLRNGKVADKNEVTGEMVMGLGLRQRLTGSGSYVIWPLRVV